jgi:hypothetical protein
MCPTVRIVNGPSAHGVALDNAYDRTHLIDMKTDGKMYTTIAVDPAAQLPATRGRWTAVYRGRGTPRERIVGWLEVFQARGRDVWVTVPDSSRWITVA